MADDAAAQEPTLKDRVTEILDRIRPYLQRDGGDLEFVELTDDNVVRVRLQGACKGCPMSQITLSRGVEAALKEEIPEVASVEAVPDGE
jgi:Fe-S cluster biogenesis protein NfuA